MSSSPRTGTTYAERLWPSAGAWALAPAAGVLAGVAALPFDARLAAVATVVVTAAAVAALVSTSPRVEVTDGVLRAGRAAIALDALGTATSAQGERARQERGPLLDARAYLCIRGWVDPVVRVAVEDPSDPTPYWLVSTRRPEDLVAAVSGRARGQA